MDDGFITFENGKNMASFENDWRLAIKKAHE